MADRSNGDNSAPGSAFWLLCRAGTRLCALPLAHIVETMRMLPIEAVPGAPRFVAGLSLIRGKPVPVVDTGAIFGDAMAPRQRLVVCNIAGRRVALAVDSVPGVLGNAPSDPLPPLLCEVAGDAVQALRVLDGELLLLLDAARLVTAAAVAAPVAAEAGQ